MTQDRDLFIEYSTTPLYNTKAVVRETNVPADTIRAWERRYGLPQPTRSAGGHRLYSARDMALIRWLRDRTAEGLTISHAIDLLRSGEQPASKQEEAAAIHSWGELTRQLLDAFLTFNAAAADQVLTAAFTTYPVEEVYLQLLKPTLVAIGDGWHAGSVSVSQEHFASNFLRNRLAGMLAAARTDGVRGRIVVACVEGELHDIGALIVALFLARRGWDVLFLGANVPTSDLLDTIDELQPLLVALSASAAETSKALRSAAQRLAASEDAPQLIYGGQAFSAPDQQIPGYYAGQSIPEMLQFLTTLTPE